MITTIIKANLELWKKKFTVGFERGLASSVRSFSILDYLNLPPVHWRDFGKLKFRPRRFPCFGCREKNKRRRRKSAQARDRKKYQQTDQRKTKRKQKRNKASRKAKRANGLKIDELKNFGPVRNRGQERPKRIRWIPADTEVGFPEEIFFQNWET